MVKPRYKYIFYGVAISIIFISSVILARHYFQFGMSAEERYRDQSHDRKLIDSTNSKLDAQLSSNYKLLAPELAKFGLTLSKPVKSVCGEGDPSLYKYSCGGGASIARDSEPETFGKPDNAARVLASFDTFMRHNGFVLDNNDFRKMRAYRGTQWVADIASGGVLVSYDKSYCSVSFHVSLSKPSYNTGAFGGLSCATDLLSGFYY
jgi:hypothetical protein